MTAVRTLACFAALVLAAPASSPAAAKSPDASMMAPINAVANALNTGNGFGTTSGPFSDGAVVVDEFAPYMWKGAGAGVAWLNSFSAFAKQAKITEAHATLQQVKYFDLASNAAYIVVPAVFSGKLNGKPFRENGLWTFALTKRGSKWLIAAETWSKQSESM